MICENCKERPASVIITQESVAGSVERQFCEKCAFHTQTFHFDPNQEPLSIQQFLSHWFGGADPFQAKQQTRGESVGRACVSVLRVDVPEISRHREIWLCDML